MPTLTDRISRLRRLIHRVGSSLRWLPPTVARLTLGWIFLQSGWGKLHSLPKVIEFFRSLGIPAPADPGAVRGLHGVSLRRADAAGPLHAAREPAR